MKTKMINTVVCAVAAAFLLFGIGQAAVSAVPQENITACILEDVEVSY